MFIGHGNRQPRRGAGWEVPAAHGWPAHADELPTPAGERGGEERDASVHRQHDVEVPRNERMLDGLAEVRIDMDVLDLGEVGRLVRSPVEDRDVVAPHEQPVHDMGAGRPRPSDHQDSHARSTVPARRTRDSGPGKRPGPERRTWIVSGHGANVVVGGSVVVGAPSSSFGTKSTAAFFTRTFVLSVGPAYL